MSSGLAGPALAGAPASMRWLYTLYTARLRYSLGTGQVGASSSPAAAAAAGALQHSEWLNQGL